MIFLQYYISHVIILAILKWPLRSVNFISLVTSCVGLQEEEEQQTAHLMSFTCASHIAASCSRDVKLYPINQRSSLLYCCNTHQWWVLAISPHKPVTLVEGDDNCTCILACCAFPDQNFLFIPHLRQSMKLEDRTQMWKKVNDTERMSSSCLTWWSILCTR